MRPDLRFYYSCLSFGIKPELELTLTGFEQTNDTVNRTGTGSARFWGLGGGAGAIRSRTVLVIAIGVHVI